MLDTDPLGEGRCVSVRSRTGTGKTAAFGIPLLEKLEPGTKTTRMLVLKRTTRTCAFGNEDARERKHSKKIFGHVPIGD